MKYLLLIINEKDSIFVSCYFLSKQVLKSAVTDNEKEQDKRYKEGEISPCMIT